MNLLAGMSVSVTAMISFYWNAWPHTKINHNILPLTFNFERVPRTKLKTQFQGYFLFSIILLSKLLDSLQFIINIQGDNN